jgi:hypothetical protein
MLFRGRGYEMHSRHGTLNPVSGNHAAKRLSGNSAVSLSLAVILLANITGHVFGEPANKPPKVEQAREIQESPVITAELINIVQAYIAAGEKSDPAARGKYLAPKVFYYGHTRTREQAVRAIASLYHRWPEREFISTDSIELFRIPEHQADYRVTALYEYKFDNPEGHEHLSGTSELTFVVEHSQQGVRIIGVDEKLVNTSTHYEHD